MKTSKKNTGSIKPLKASSQRKELASKKGKLLSKEDFQKAMKKIKKEIIMDLEMDKEIVF